MIDVKQTIDGILSRAANDNVVPIDICLNLVHRTLLGTRLAGLGLHDGPPETLREYRELPIITLPAPSAHSAVRARRPGFPSRISYPLA